MGLGSPPEKIMEFLQGSLLPISVVLIRDRSFLIADSESARRELRWCIQIYFSYYSIPVHDDLMFILAHGPNAPIGSIRHIGPIGPMDPWAQDKWNISQNT